MSQRILVTGASGLLGRAIFKTSKAHTDWTTTGLAFSRTSIELEKVDLTQENQVMDIVRRIQVSVTYLILCALHNNLLVNRIVRNKRIST